MAHSSLLFHARHTLGSPPGYPFSLTPVQPSPHLFGRHRGCASTLLLQGCVLGPQDGPLALPAGLPQPQGGRAWMDCCLSLSISTWHRQERPHWVFLHAITSMRGMSYYASFWRVLYTHGAGLLCHALCSCMHQLLTWCSHLVPAFLAVNLSRSLPQQASIPTCPATNLLPRPPNPLSHLFPSSCLIPSGPYTPNPPPDLHGLLQHP